MAESQLPLADELAVLAGRMSRLMLSEGTVASALEVLTGLVVRGVPAATGAGVSLIGDDGQKMSAAATSELVLEADALQYSLGEGPCLTSWAERRIVRIDDVREETRYTRWCTAVQDLGVASVLSAGVFAGDRSVGAIKVYSHRPGAFDGRDESMLEGFGQASALLLVNVQSLENARRLSQDLRQALQSRDLVQIAKGVVMERAGVDEEQAFQTLVAQANERGTELRQVAGDTVKTASGSPG